MNLSQKSADSPKAAFHNLLVLKYEVSLQNNSLVHTHIQLLYTCPYLTHSRYVCAYVRTWVHGYIGTWVHGYMGTWVHGYMGTWVHRYMGTWNRL